MFNCITGVIQGYTGQIRYDGATCVTSSRTAARG